MPVYALGDQVPRIHPEAFIAPTATVVGDVVIGARASVWYGAVVRGDSSFRGGSAGVVIEEGANVQDNAVLHDGGPGMPLIVRRGATIAHSAIVHAADIGEEALIANGAVVLDGARIGARALVAAGSVVPSGGEVPEGMLAAGSPAVVKRSIEGTQSGKWVQQNPQAYQDLAALHRRSIREVPVEGLWPEGEPASER